MRRMDFIASVNLLPLVRSFTFDVREAQLDPTSLAKITNTLLSSLPFENLRKLDVLWRDWSRFIYDDRTLLPALIRRNIHLETLILQNQWISSLEELETYLGFRSPNLRCLGLYEVGQTELSTAEVHTIISCLKTKVGYPQQGLCIPRLQELGVGSVNMQILGDIILDPEVYDLRCLDRMAFPFGLRDVVLSKKMSTGRRQLLHTQAERITSLSCELRYFRSASVLDSSLPQVPLPNLSRLELLAVINIEVLLSALDRIIPHAPNLEALHIGMYWQPRHRLFSLHDSPISAFLDPRLRSLLDGRRLCVSVSVDLAVNSDMVPLLSTEMLRTLFSQTTQLPGVTFEARKADQWWGKDLVYQAPSVYSVRYKYET
ncbi:hypothetical protein WG66_007265 [Moniliophthora roreri]|uniref:F-box domain-containing protein n=1 Tax=Moniliophthora roreri TaxID=221103 RepID=A0A0W0FW75_MONRR|nr:hypothetical protein WG66_007265 [Moniliophthora roreri]